MGNNRIKAANLQGSGVINRCTAKYMYMLPVVIYNITSKNKTCILLQQTAKVVAIGVNDVLRMLNFCLILIPAKYIQLYIFFNYPQSNVNGTDMLAWEILFLTCLRSGRLQ